MRTRYRKEGFPLSNIGNPSINFNPSINPIITGGNNINICFPMGGYERGGEEPYKKDEKKEKAAPYVKDIAAKEVDETPVKESVIEKKIKMTDPNEKAKPFAEEYKGYGTGKNDYVIFREDSIDDEKGDYNRVEEKPEEAARDYYKEFSSELDWYNPSDMMEAFVKYMSETELQESREETHARTEEKAYEPENEADWISADDIVAKIDEYRKMLAEEAEEDKPKAYDPRNDPHYVSVEDMIKKMDEYRKSLIGTEEPKNEELDMYLAEVLGRKCPMQGPGSGYYSVESMIYDITRFQELKSYEKTEFLPVYSLPMVIEKSDGQEADFINNVEYLFEEKNTEPDAPGQAQAYEPGLAGKLKDYSSLEEANIDKIAKRVSQEKPAYQDDAGIFHSLISVEEIEGGFSIEVYSGTKPVEEIENGDIFLVDKLTVSTNPVTYLTESPEKTSGENSLDYKTRKVEDFFNGKIDMKKFESAIDNITKKRVGKIRNSLQEFYDN